MPPDVEYPWQTVSSHFTSLGNRLRQTYREAGEDGGPSEDEIREALATLAGAWRQVSDSLSTALKDPATRAQLKDTASSLAAALGATFTDLGVELRDGPTPSEGSPAGGEEQGPDR